MDDILNKIEARHVYVEYHLKQTNQTLLALEDVSFAIPEGQFIAIVGPTGCGKTTLLNVMAGLQPVSKGMFLSDGKTILKAGPDKAMVFQAPCLMPWRNVRRNIAYGLELRGHTRKEAGDLAQTYIHMVGLKGFENSYPYQLSGGMQQRVNFARALAIEPSILLLDEPLSALDAQTRLYMQSELQRIWLKLKNTAVYVTHQISEAIYLADQVLVMSARPGKIKEVVPVDFPRPRSLSVEQDRPFNQIKRYIWDLLKEEVITAGTLMDREP